MKIKTLTIFLFYFCSLLVTAQEKNTINKLKTELESERDTLSKIKLLEKLWQKTVYDSENEAINYAKEAILLSEKIDNNKQLARAHERLGISLSNISKYKESNKAYTRASQINESLGKMRRVGGLLINKGINFKNVGQLDSALHYVNKSKNYVNLSCCKDDSILLANFYSTKAQILLEKGFYVTALENAISATGLAKMVNDSIQYADNLKIIADSNESLGNYDAAISYFKESIDIYKEMEDTYYECESSRSLGILYGNVKPIEIDSAKKYLVHAIKLSEAIKIPLLQEKAMNDYANLLLKIKRYDEATTYLDRSKPIAELIKDTFGLSDIYLVQGKIKLKTANYKGSITDLKLALNLKRKIGLLPGTTETLLNLSKAYKGLGDNKNALSYHEEYKVYSDSLYNTEKATKFDELQTIYDTQKKEAEITLKNEEIKILNVQARNDRLTKTLYGIGMFSFLAIAGLLYFGFKQRIKKNRIAREKQEEIYKQEIEFKKKELASQTLHLVQKSTFIQELKENLEKIKKSPELFKVEFRRLVMLLKKESAEDKDWEVFKSYFSEVHNNFDHKIKDIAGDITDKEMRLASFLRMNLSTKEIASMLNVLPDSVLKSKYRLKKKLQLDKEADLSQFLKSL